MSKIAIGAYTSKMGNKLKNTPSLMELYNSRPEAVRVKKENIMNNKSRLSGTRRRSINESDVSDLYDEFSEYPYAADAVAYYIYGNKDSDNAVASAIKGRHSKRIDPEPLSSFMLDYEYSWKDNMADIDSFVKNYLDGDDDSQFNEARKIFTENMKRLDSVGHNKNNLKKDEYYGGWNSAESQNVYENLKKDDYLINEAINFMEDYQGVQPYRDFIQSAGLFGTRTLEGIEWINQNLDYNELNIIMRELHGRL